MVGTAGVLVSMLLLGVAACTGSSAHQATNRRQPSPARSSTSTRVVDRHRLSGGCGNPIYQGDPPSWAAMNAPDLPYVIANAGRALGYLFGHPLRAASSHGASQDKILWYVRLPREGHRLRIEARPRGRHAPIVRSEQPADSGPGEIYPSIVQVPTPGCWHVTLTWGSHTDTIDLHYQPALG
jgi:hypothetical protein